MNPKISISIDNNKAAAVLTGMFTVGAKVDVEVTGLPDGIPNWGADDKFTGKSLRFRIVDACGKDLARFPLVEKGTGTDGDTWTVDAETGKYSTTSGCVFNMDTDKLRTAFAEMPFNAKLEFGMVFDSIVDAAQYAIGKVKVSQWSASSEEDPTVLPDWRETLAKLDADLEQVEDAKSDAETAAAAAQVAQSAAQTSAANAAASAASAASSADRAKGVPAGGTTGQVLKKRSGTDYDVEWSSGGGGTSDYGDLTNKPQIGGVTLTGNKTLGDLGAASAAEVAAKYAKPASGIPATDMAAAVQTALTAAANAAPQATTYTKTEVDGALAAKVAATNGTATNLVMVANDVSAVRVAFAHGSIEYSYDGWETIGNLCLPFPADLPQDCDIACLGNLPYALSSTETAPTTRTVITKVLAAGATTDSYTLPAIDGTANTVQNCDIVVDARACTGDSIALTLTPTGTDIILYPGGTAPTLKKGTVTVIDCTSVKLGNDLVWLVMGATEMQAAS